MHLNTLAPALGAKKTAQRRGRGIGSGLGKTGGRGHKGLKSRSGGTVPLGFEGGQTPQYRRLPKYGFVSRKKLVTREITLTQLAKVQADVIDLAALKKADLITHTVLYVKVIQSGTLARPVKLQGLRVSAGAKAAIEAAGGQVLEAVVSA